MSKLYASATNSSNIISAQVTNSYKDASAMASFKVLNTSLTIGDNVDLYLGYVGDYSKVFSGYVKEIKKSEPPFIYEINAYDAMIRASDYFIACANPDNPISYSNINAETLVGNLMALAGLTDYGYDATSFIFATQAPLEINLETVYDYCNTIADTLAWHLYADMNGKIWFVERWGRLMDGDSSSYEIDRGTVLAIGYSEDERDLRNRIVVYGGGGVYAVASEVSEHLPEDFYKTTVASAEWIDTTTMAQKAADYNLDLLNELNREINMTLIGNPDIFVRDIVEFNFPRLSLSGDWLVYTVDHDFSKNGFTTQVTLKK